MTSSTSARLRSSLVMLGLACASMQAGAWVVTSAQAFAGAGFVCCAPLNSGGITSGFTGGVVADRDRHDNNSPSSASAVFFDQLLDATTPSGYAFRDGSVASAWATIGALGVAAEAKAFSSTGRFGGNNVSGTAEAFFEDEITFLTARTRFSLDIDGFTSQAAVAEGILTLQGDALIHFIDGPVVGGGAARQRRFECLAPGGFFVDCDGSVTLVVPTHTPLSFFVLLAVEAAASGTQESWATYDRTLHTTIESLDPGSFVSASGYAYAPQVPEPPAGAVPEPAGSLLLGAGLMGLMASRRLRRKPNAPINAVRLN